MHFITLKYFNDFQKHQLLDLWHKHYPVNLHYENLEEFEAYLDSIDGSQHTLIIDKDVVKGWLAIIPREDNCWVALILDASIQFQGLGSQLLDSAKENHAELYAWVVDHNNYQLSNGKSYQSPLDFYLKNGFTVIADTRLEQDKISAVKIHWHR
jgi:GNAT superfamily N-acetyltransferase